MFHRPTKHKILQTEKELNTLSKTLIKSDETTETLASISHNQDTCLFSESPHYIVRVWLIYKHSFYEYKPKILDRWYWKCWW
jgi:hypothetical protein